MGRVLLAVLPRLRLGSPLTVGTSVPGCIYYLHPIHDMLCITIAILNVYLVGASTPCHCLQHSLVKMCMPIAVLNYHVVCASLLWYYLVDDCHSY